MRRFIILFLGSAATGCAGFTTVGPAPAAAPRPTTSILAPTTRTWDAVIDLFSERNIPIKSIDRSSGFIATDALAVPMRGAEALADCGSSLGVPYLPEHATYNVLVRGDSTTSTARVTVRWVSDRETRGAVECTTKGVWETAFEQEVKRRAETKK